MSRPDTELQPISSKRRLTVCPFRRPMIGDVPKLLAFLVCSLFAIADSAAARLQSATGQPQVSGSARLTVRVVADDNGRPVKRASVNVLLLPDSQERVDQRRSYVSRRVETDNNGRSEIANLRPGTYSVSVDEIGGFVFPTRQQYVIVTESGTAVITVRVERAGAIEGRIQDENGEGILGAQIQAVRHLSLGLDTAPAMRGASANTNDRGEFRLFNLSPGTY